MSTTEGTATQRQAEQRGLLDDPIAFSREVWDEVFYANFDAIFRADRPAVLYRVRDGALHLAEEAASRGRPDIASAAIGIAQDAANDLAGECALQAQMEGAILERLRQDLVALAGWMAERDAEAAERHQAALARLEALRRAINCEAAGS